MQRRNFVKSLVSTPFALAATSSIAADARPLQPGNLRNGVLNAMRRAVQHMDEKVSFRGGYVWAYLPDLTVTWGEMEAKRSMCWIQPPGTPTVGHAFIDAWNATGEDVFYAAAERTALALIEAQLPCGGWNYIHDFAGEESLKHWYETIGRNGWRLEEFHHHYGNATFDDAGTATTAQVLLRMYLAKRDERFRAPLYRAIDFILQAQYKGGMADGGWPQRWPHFSGSTAHMPTPPGLPDGARHGMEDGDYTPHVTWNDDVAGENVKFLLLCVMGLGETRLLPAVKRAMDCMLRMQQPAPQAGWGLQHLAAPAQNRPAGAPAGARSYEPRALTTHTTATNIQQLFHYFRLTGDRKYLARIPEAISWLKTCTLSEQMLAENPLLRGRTHATFIELGSNRPRFVHRYGSNVHNGAYYTDHDHRDTPSHYSAGRTVNTDALQAEYETLMGLPAAAVTEMHSRSPLALTAPVALPHYFSLREVDFPDLFAGARISAPAVSEGEAGQLIQDLGDKNYWATPLPAITNPYRGDGPRAAHAGREYMSRNVGDRYDTSPYDPRIPPDIAPYTKQDRPLGITTSSFVSKLGKLIAFYAPEKS
ncbi:pectate lyase [Uliginosibacterium sp. 31-16]|uniref:pectate lyase n=1 Tax=Uliginosibacterium sp. 31-16 TaxID=3068315 RepID=UPI00273D3B2D|nr:pectate lyase [Uliginosibacterium sp. 31-16]MDP5238186.1 pectate lyase [Uliginosibacterium sp. 31-16]